MSEFAPPNALICLWHRRDMRTKIAWSYLRLLDQRMECHIGHSLLPCISLRWCGWLKPGHFGVTLGKVDCNTDGPLESAYIWLSQEEIRNEVDLWRTLAHEYCHVLDRAENGPFDMTRYGGHNSGFWRWARRIDREFRDIPPYVRAFTRRYP